MSSRPIFLRKFFKFWSKPNLNTSTLYKCLLLGGGRQMYPSEFGAGTQVSLSRQGLKTQGLAGAVEKYI